MNLAFPVLNFIKSHTFKNSLWGISTSVFQNLVFSLFFIILARCIESAEFSSYIIANTFYGVILSFSTLGMGQWFIRKILNSEDKGTVITLFLFVQLFSGIIFYGVQILLVFHFYDEHLIRLLSLILGFNIILDNLIYVFKSVNIAFNSQRHTFYNTTFEALLKLILAIVIWKNGVPIVHTVTILVILRFVTLYFFARQGFGSDMQIKIRIPSSISFLFNVSDVVFQNRYFILIGSMSVFFWSYGNIAVSKIIGLKSVPDYEISYKLFTMSEIIPLMFSASIFPVLVKMYESNSIAIKRYFRKMFWLYAVYGLFSFAFIYFISDLFIPLLFGNQFIHTSVFVREIFLTMLLFPTSLLQANLIISMGAEKYDMWFNVVSLCVLVTVSFVLLHFIKSLSIINYSIFLSFWIFHILQDVFLFKKGIVLKSDLILFHLIVVVIFTLFLINKASILVL